MSKRIEIEQGSDEWLALRRSKITATDAPVIMGVSPWKSLRKLYFDKVDGKEAVKTERMTRGLELEPIARQLFSLRTGIDVAPAVLVDDWRMASLDGISADGAHIVEIKCPGAADHSAALAGTVPAHYYPQLQHQMALAGVSKMFYFSFDGIDGAIVEVPFSDSYADDMIAKERLFYEQLLRREAPEPSFTDYVLREDSAWLDIADRYKLAQQRLKACEAEEQALRAELIKQCGADCCRGGGVSVSISERRGTVDYSKVPELAGVDLEAYRKAASKYYRVSCY